jgi:hypothetical protein
MKNALALVALASCVTALCRAASPSPVPENLLACRKLQDESERVRCYDAQIDKLTGLAANTPAPAQAAPNAPVAAKASAPSAAAASKQSATAKFGEETLPPTSRPTTPQEEMALLSSITAMRAVAPQMYVISLANGQVWRQEQASQIALFFRVGDDVRIAKGALGSYHMSTDKTGAKNWVRVTRIQ